MGISSGGGGRGGVGFRSSAVVGRGGREGGAGGGRGGAGGRGLQKGARGGGGSGWRGGAGGAGRGEQPTYAQHLAALAAHSSVARFVREMESSVAAMGMSGAGSVFILIFYLGRFWLLFIFTLL